MKKKIKLGKHLILNSYANDLFGKKRFEEFQVLLKDVKEGFDEEGRSYVFKVLSGQKNIKIPIDKLEEYDSNIKGYVDKINYHREKPIVLKYFQYLSVLFTDIFLDKYFRDPVNFLNEVNSYAENVEDNNIFFRRDDLTKLAFWMATGSGKTLIMHINYLQFVKYNKGSHQIKPDNILLITPSENLSDQHLAEMRKSGLPCDLFLNMGRGYFSGMVNQNIIRIIDIHKLTGEKKGEGVTVDVKEFGSNNLVFVDEGHKGSGGVKWKRFREFVAKEGFTFEYSATFGQAIALNESLLEEYGKSIIFDYSYRHFYNDGYGKDYRILNLRDKKYSENIKDMLMLANLLSFYEQKLLFEDYKDVVKEYNIENPLWIYVGSKVRGKLENSDILRVVQFLTKILKNENNWVVKSIENILRGNSGLLDKEGGDLFSPDYPERKLQYLKNKGVKAGEVFTDILKRIFYVSGSVSLHLVNIKNADGEIALRAGNSQFFGVINIGDESGFLSLVEKTTDIPVEKDELSSSLFDSIKDPQSRINVLIGAKKFIEGWDCWRVSNMGLLNIGKSEGTQIIQLFGRGVRLKGKDFLLKRSGAIEQKPPKYLKVFETLNIFGIEANYMDQFREHLETEGISTDNYIEIPFPIQINDDFLKKELVIPYIDSSRFKKEDFFRLEVDESIDAKIDLMPKVEILTSFEDEGIRATTSNPVRHIEQKFLDLFDWNKIYFSLLNHKIEQGWNNIVFSKDTLRKIMEKNLYTLHCPDVFVKPDKFEDIWRLEDVVTMILKKYIQSFYNSHSNIWEQKNMEIVQLKKDHDNLSFERYTLKIKEEEKFIISEIKSLVKSKMAEIYREFSSNYINNVYFDRHLYQPLLADQNNIMISPVGLNEGEKTFIMDLKNYFVSNIQFLKDREVFILRNLPRRGIGFFENHYFYPDFIIWVKDKDKQHLLFVDPKGLAHMQEGLDEEKIQLFRKIKDVEKELAKKAGVHNIFLDSFIISVSLYHEVREIFKNKPRNKLEEKHILFQKDDKKNYVQKLMDVALKIPPS